MFWRLTRGVSSDVSLRWLVKNVTVLNRWLTYLRKPWRTPQRVYLNCKKSLKYFYSHCINKNFNAQSVTLYAGILLSFVYSWIHFLFKFPSFLSLSRLHGKAFFLASSPQAAATITSLYACIFAHSVWHTYTSKWYSEKNTLKRRKEPGAGGWRVEGRGAFPFISNE